MVGVGDGEMFIASAIPAFLSETRRIVVLDDGDIVTVSADGASFCDLDGGALERETSAVTWDADAAEKGGYETFMLKEIYEQPQALADTLAGRLTRAGVVDLSEMGLGDDELRRLRRIFIVACGTSYHAGLIASYAIEELARVPVQIDVASEFRYRDPVLDAETLVIGITPVGRDGRHARRHAARARGRLARPGAHQHHGQPGHARGRRRALHARRSRDRCRGDQDARRPGRRPPALHARPGPRARLAAARRSACASDASCTRPRCWSSGCSTRRAKTGTTACGASPSATTTSVSSSTWAATWASASASRARSSSRRSATSRPRRTPPAR